MHLTYTHGGRYANAARSVRKGKSVTKEYIHLGTVVDKEKGIYDHKEIGITGFDLEKGVFVGVDHMDIPRPMMRERLILDFGDSYFMDRFMRDIGIFGCIDEVLCGNPDSLRSLVMYYMVTSDNAACHAEVWYEGNYARCLYPEANMDGRRISEFYERIGQEDNWRAFFDSYISLVTEGHQQVNVAIDSTGAPNDCHLDVTAISNHNGVISNEVRLILVVDKDTGLPIFLRYVPGNIVDQSTLVRTLTELRLMGVECAYVLLDAGYQTDDNIAYLFSQKVDFITRLNENRKLYKDLREKHASKLERKENFVLYGDRRLYVKRVQCELAPGCKGYAYCILDMERKNSEDSHVASKAFKEGLTAEEAYESMEGTGFFVLVSNMRLERDVVIPDYYLRQNVEQFLDVGKNYANLLPLRKHSEDTFRGHLLVAFIASAVLQMLQNSLMERGKVHKQGPERKIGNKSPNIISALGSLRNQKCKVYEETILPLEAQAVANSAYRLMGYEVPLAIPIKPSKSAKDE